MVKVGKFVGKCGAAPLEITARLGLLHFRRHSEHGTYDTTTAIANFDVHVIVLRPDIRHSLV